MWVCAHACMKALAHSVMRAGEFEFYRKNLGADEG